MIPAGGQELIVSLAIGPSSNFSFGGGSEGGHLIKMTDEIKSWNDEELFSETEHLFEGWAFFETGHSIEMNGGFVIKMTEEAGEQAPIFLSGVRPSIDPSLEVFF